MLPTIEIGALRLNTYWLIYGLAIVAGGMLAFDRLVRGGVSPRKALSGLWLIIWAGLAGSVLFKGLALVARDLALTGELAGGLNRGSAFLGALLGGTAAGWRWFRRCGVPPGRAFDLFLAPAPLSQAIGRIGCLAAACCHGRPTDSWLGLYLPDHDGFWAVRYPTQLLSAAADLLIFVALLGLERAIRRGSTWARWLAFDGALTTVYFLLYSAKRFSVEFLRADTTLRLVGALTLTHLFYALIFLAAFAAGFWGWMGLLRPKGCCAIAHNAPRNDA
jgi:phosphatidylglycerol:prolipoprotein diacylglycerol transferase